MARAHPPWLRLCQRGLRQLILTAETGSNRATHGPARQSVQDPGAPTAPDGVGSMGARSNAPCGPSPASTTARALSRGHGRRSAPDCSRRQN
jgi:hypothetical protein